MISIFHLQPSPTVVCVVESARIVSTPGLRSTVCDLLLSRRDLDYSAHRPHRSPQVARRKPQLRTPFTLRGGGPGARRRRKNPQSHFKTQTPARGVSRPSWKRPRPQAPTSAQCLRAPHNIIGHTGYHRARSAAGPWGACGVVCGAVCRLGAGLSRTAPAPASRPRRGPVQAACELC